MPRPSTFSIVAFDPAVPAWGVAVASKFPAVGAVVPWARAGCGAIATQALANTGYGPLGLDLMQSGVSAQQALSKLVQDDPEQAQRQAGIVDQQGRSATFTGGACMPWAGGITGDSFAVQGNILTGPQVVERMVEAFQSSPAHLPDRLLAALLAGDEAGGDRRGRQSAALLVVREAGGYGGHNDRWIDYRVDDDPAPIPRLVHLLKLHSLHFGESPPHDRVPLHGAPLEALQSVLLDLGYLERAEPGVYDPSTRAALRAFVGNENFEERTDIEQGLMDRPVFDYLVQSYESGRPRTPQR